MTDKTTSWRLALSRNPNLNYLQALMDVSFNVPKGQFVGILGRNGAGKSTLLRVLGGVYPPDKGRVGISGNVSGLYELGFAGNPLLSGRQYAERMLIIHGYSKAERSVMLSDIEEFSELGSRFNDAVLTYSSGMAARLFFSTATAGQHDVYLIDEILSVGDQHFQGKCWRRLRELISGGSSGVLVTHDWSAVLRLCETTHIMKDGQIIFSGPTALAVRQYLYGELGNEKTTSGIARFLKLPNSPISAQPGQDLVIEVEVEIDKVDDISVVAAIERMQPGYGWETTLMSRHPTLVGGAPGRYRTLIKMPRLPLEPGSYQLSIHLVRRNPDLPSCNDVVDGCGWLSGNGIGLTVVGDSTSGLALPSQWTVNTR